jgi:hypothetical protein
MAVSRQGFFSKIRSLFGGHLDQSQVDGMNAILDAFERALPQGDLRWLAYMLATAFHETAKTMQPVREAFWLSEDWRRKNLRYYPYYGRGYVQLTWKENYERAGVRVGANLVASPDLAMRDDIAARHALRDDRGMVPRRQYGPSDARPLFRLWSKRSERRAGDHKRQGIRHDRRRSDAAG